MHKSPFKHAACLWPTAGLAGAGVHAPSRDTWMWVRFPLPDGRPTRSARSCAGWGQGGRLSGPPRTSLLTMEGAAVTTSLPEVSPCDLVPLTARLEEVCGESESPAFNIPMWCPPGPPSPRYPTALRPSTVFPLEQLSKDPFCGGRKKPSLSGGGCRF